MANILFNFIFPGTLPPQPNIPDPQNRIQWIPLPPSRPLAPPLIPYITKTFQSFSRLPIELRLKIWVYASPGPRILELRSWGNTHPNIYQPVSYTLSPNYVPSITLFVCRESRREALRHYTLVHLGTSAQKLDPERRYLPWISHPENPRNRDQYPFSPLRYENGIAALPALAYPNPPRPIWVNYDLDTLYLGPEFRPEHLQQFLVSAEFPGLKHVALDRKAWLYGERTSLRFNFGYLRHALRALGRRPLESVAVVPDDEGACLEDRFYRGRHDLDFVRADWEWRFSREGEGKERQRVMEGLEGWFGQVCGRRVRVHVKSVRRNRERMKRGGFREGMGRIQMLLGDERVWGNFVGQGS